MGTDHEGQPDESEDSAPTVTSGGVMPGGSQLAGNANAYPRTDASNRGSLPQAIADSLGDPTGGKGWGPLHVLAVEQDVVGADTMTRAELADQLNATMTVEEVVEGLRSTKTPDELLAAATAK